jgi:drug/metabolite transporter (DMT)-like permease
LNQGREIVEVMTTPPRASPEYSRGLLLTASGTVLVSFEALFLRLVGVDIWTVIWWRGLLLGITALAVLAMSGRSLHVRSLGVAGLAAIIAFAACVFSFVSAINATTVANTLVIASAAPLFAALQSWLFLRERITRATWGAVIIVFVGIAIIFSGSLRTSFLLGDLSALVYAGCLSAYYVALRRCPGAHMLSIVACGGLLSGLLAWPMAMPVAVTPGDLLPLLVLGVVIVPASTMLLSLGTRYIPAPHVTLIMMLEMILGPLWVWFILGEVPPHITVLGGVLILMTVGGHSYISGTSRPIVQSDPSRYG